MNDSLYCRRFFASFCKVAFASNENIDRSLLNFPDCAADFLHCFNRAHRFIFYNDIQIDIAFFGANEPKRITSIAGTVCVMIETSVCSSFFSASVFSISIIPLCSFEFSNENRFIANDCLYCDFAFCIFSLQIDKIKFFLRE